MHTLVEMDGSLGQFEDRRGRCLLLGLLLLLHLLFEQSLKLFLYAIDLVGVGLDGFVIVACHFVAFSTVLGVEYFWRACDELSRLNIDRLLEDLCLVL